MRARKTHVGRHAGGFGQPLRILAGGACSFLCALCLAQDAPRGTAGASVSAPPATALRAVHLDLAAEWKAQFIEVMRHIAQRGKQPPAGEVFRRDAMILPEDRDPTDVVLRRTEALLKDIKQLSPARDFTGFESELVQVKADAEKVAMAPERIVGKKGPGEKAPTANDAVIDPAQKARFEIFATVCALRRRIAFSNPLLNFDQLLFVKRYRRTKSHICKQFFGARVTGGPGGGIYVLHDPFGPNPSLRNLLSNATVRNGRLKGQKLEGGSFLSPEVSYDGNTIVFAYTECGPGPSIAGWDTRIGVWNRQKAYHVFAVNADGTNLRQLTDGQWNDFDPCFLPNGRIVFVSERRGGFGRCFPLTDWPDLVPTCALHSMNADGSDVIPLSYHETHEWQPSVNNDGMIVYTRWDYVDREACVAHHPWITSPDGRAARAIQGNYNARSSRPDAEMDVRAIPNSSKYVATAAGHHLQSYGSLAIIDPCVPDYDAMAPLKRLTPNTRFPEIEGGGTFYGTAWPLSEDYYLCVYGGGLRRDGVYLLDSFGNHIPIYLDESIECISPMPLRARIKPSELPHLAAVGKPIPAVGGHAEPAVLAKGSDGTDVPPAKPAGTSVVGCANVHDGLLPWPDGTKITALRIIQLFPRATPHYFDPPVARDGRSMCRGVLGTVPVESDGSCHFELPAGKLVYFQALDEKGLAVQSMKSAAYAHPGERLVCQGCHERVWNTPPLPRAVPLAFRRDPSVIKPDVDGSYPVLFPRLVQPVLDRHCVACHAKEPKAPNLTGEIAGAVAGQLHFGPPKRSPVTKSYQTLAKNMIFDASQRQVLRTVPGEFGARASKLYALLTGGHHDVRLPAEDMHRITVWLDCNSNFLGDYYNTERQAKGESFVPALE